MYSFFTQPIIQVIFFVCLKIVIGSIKYFHYLPLQNLKIFNNKISLKMNLTGHEFLKLGNVYTKSSLTKSKPIALRRFKTFFGVCPTICSIVWKELNKNGLPQGALPKHLLWCLSFLKQYSTEHCRRSLFRSDEKTIRKWTWIFVKLLSDMNVVICFYFNIELMTNLKDNCILDNMGRSFRWCSA